MLPVGEPDRGEREAAVAGRRELRAREDHRGSRSGPNHGLARPPFTGLRVVAMSSVGSAEIAEASNRAPRRARPAQPPSASARRRGERAEKCAARRES